MKEIPILFKPELAQAIFEGKKTQTRRVNGLDIINKTPSGWTCVEIKNNMLVAKMGGRRGRVRVCKCPYSVGDWLWVREPWAEKLCAFCGCHPCGDDEAMYNCGCTLYRGTGDAFYERIWKPSIHMPKRLCRSWCKIKSVRVERVCDISERDAIKEGVFGKVDHDLAWRVVVSEMDSAKASFFKLWDAINGARGRRAASKNGIDYSTIANPWVWVIEFERIEK